MFGLKTLFNCWKRRDFFHGILQHLADGVLVLDGDARVLFANRVGLRIFGYSEEEILLLVVSDLISDAETGATIDDLELTLAQGKRRDGRDFPVEYSVTHAVIRGVSYCIYTVRDVSEFNLIKTKVMKMGQINTELRRAYEELKEKEGRLIQKERWVSIGQLSAGIAHEINNPLGFVETNMSVLQMYVSKFSEMLRTYEQGVEGEQFLEKRQELRLDEALQDVNALFHQTQEGLYRMGIIVQSLKNFSQLESLSSRSPFNLNVGLANTLLICQNEYKYHADIVTRYGDVPLVMCDAGKISQVFLNLIINASQAIKEKFVLGERGRIFIETFADERFVWCRIKDTGAGISDANRTKIFDPFFTTKDPKVGTGLGLSLSYDIIQKHGGELYVEDSEDEGAVFVIKLPLS